MKLHHFITFLRESMPPSPQKIPIANRAVVISLFKYKSKAISVQFQPLFLLYKKEYFLKTNAKIYTTNVLNCTIFLNILGGACP